MAMGRTLLEPLATSMENDRLDTLSSEKSDLVQELESIRRKFSRKLQEVQKAKIPYLDRTSELPQELIDNCKLVQNRLELLRLLPKKAVVAEVGTDRGDFAKQILQICSPTQLHIFEIDTSRIVQSNVESGLADGIVTIHPGDSASSMRLMPDQSFDWIYIDGDHSYTGARADITASVPKLKEGGLLVFNDYTVWSPSSMSRCGVAKAVNEFCISEQWEMLYLAFQTMMYNDVVLRKKS